MHRSHGEQPAVITTAPPSADDEWDLRRKKYAIMMATRAVCIVLAALTYRFSLWLALAFIAGGAVLPWCAVIIANDLPPKRRRSRLGYHVGHERGLPSGHDDRTIEG